MFLEISQNSQENTCVRLSFLITLQAWPATLLKKETLAQVFSREICEISKNTFSYRTTRVAASVRLCFCKVSGLEYRILLKQDLFKNVFLGIFQKFSEELFRRISTRSSHPEYSTKKVFSPAALLTKRLRYK